MTKKPVKKKIPKPETQNPEAEKQEIKVIERIIENTEIAPQDAFGQLNRQQIDLIKRTIAKGATDDELRLFIQVCKGANLNPFLKQVFLVKRWDSREGKEVGAIQVSIDGFRSIAESSGQYAGNDDPVFQGELQIEKSKGEKIAAPKQATVTVHKVIDGQRYPFTATARWAEYYPGQKQGFQWHIRPYLMLGKCAEALALRKAFPKLLSGMYEEGELANNPQSQQTANVPAAPADVFKALKERIEKASAKELQEFKEKISQPGKKAYTEEQKADLLAIVEARLAKEDDGIPIINLDEQES